MHSTTQLSRDKKVGHQRGQDARLDGCRRHRQVRGRRVHEHDARRRGTSHDNRAGESQLRTPAASVEAAFADSSFQLPAPS
jgi:hypothetical protein